MGTWYQFKCPGCGYSAEVSGSDDVPSARAFNLPQSSDSLAPLERFAQALAAAMAST